MLLDTPFNFESHQVFIDGVWRNSDSAETLSLINPSDGTTLCDIAHGNANDIDSAVNAAAAFLCSDEASMITGVAMEVDGGRCI